MQYRPSILYCSSDFPHFHMENHVHGTVVNCRRVIIFFFCTICGARVLSLSLNHLMDIFVLVRISKHAIGAAHTPAHIPLWPNKPRLSARTKTGQQFQIGTRRRISIGNRNNYYLSIGLNNIRNINMRTQTHTIFHTTFSPFMFCIEDGH